MKLLQKLILPALFVLIIIIVYVLYFAPKDELGSFSDFDPNNSAVKEIRVTFLADRGVNQDGHSATFFVSDKNNTTMQVNADHVPQGIESATILILHGHLSGSSAFHAHEVEIE